MTLVANLIRQSDAQPGDTKWTIVAVAAGTAVIEPQVHWLVCNGAALATTGKYALLFAQIGYAHGGAGGTFNIPDCRDGYNPIPMGATNFTTLGAAGGEYVHVLNGSEVPSHNHPSMYDGFGTADGGSNWNPNLFAGGGYQGSTTRSTDGGVGAAGSGHENMPPIVTVACKLIRY